jgi:hypothetical protein
LRSKLIPTNLTERFSFFEHDIALRLVLNRWAFVMAARAVAK